MKDQLQGDQGNWLELGDVPPGDLTEARLQSHWAAQLVAAVGKTFIDARPDDSHPNMGFVAAGGLLRGHPTDTSPPLHASLAIDDLELRLDDASGREVESLGLSGATLNDGFVWLSEAIGRNAEGIDRALDRALYDIPDHGVGAGDTFGGVDRTALHELRLWYHNADHALARFTDDVENASPVRCWPHHFDLGTLILLDGDSSRSVGIGMTPGDEYYAEPYWYVNPYPLPESYQLPALAGSGHWHKKDWVGAVLTGSVLAAVNANRQEAVLKEFLDSAYSAAQSLIQT